MGTAIDAALERGRKAAKGKWQPKALKFNGRLTAILEDEKAGQTESVYKFRSELLYSKLGRRDGEIVVHVVRDRALKKVALAMLGGEKHRADLIRECVEERKRDQAERDAELEDERRTVKRK